MEILKEIYDRCVSIFGNIFFWMGLLGIVLTIAAEVRVRNKGRKKSAGVRPSARRIAIVTGASKGLGRGYVAAIAKQMQAFDIEEFWLIARNKDALTELANETGVPCIPMPLDLTSGSSFQVIGEMLASRDYDVRLLMNCAGIGFSGTSAEIGNKGEQTEIALNDCATVAMVQTCLPYMSAGSRIVNIASISSFQSLKGFNVYSASKAFVLSYSRGLRQEVSSQGISVTVVCPYWVRDTGFIEHSTGAKSSPFLSSTTDRVVRRSLRTIKRRGMMSTPSIVSFLDFIFGPLFPDIVLSKIAGILNLKRKK
ncbi:MAG: SDR family NAD(P)-dependent oxidoreductase [Lachnospiraceae bacterium]|nr:SDR family NAD(P)-dependent oxidoreductase [Lachnospiraceae bacterium]